MVRPSSLGRGGQTSLHGRSCLYQGEKAQAMTTFLSSSEEEGKEGCGPIPPLLQKAVAFPPLQESLPLNASQSHYT